LRLRLLLLLALLVPQELLLIDLVTQASCWRTAADARTNACCCHCCSVSRESHCCLCCCLLINLRC
jgi:hypothetical protein